jgi:hypothetical protein
MVLKLGRSGKEQQVSLPWESIDSHEADSPTTWESPNKESQDQGHWFLDAPDGEWQMESAPKSADPDDDNSAAPIETFEEVQDEQPAPREDGPQRGGWTVAILCMGLGIIAAAVIIPQADANRRLVYEREKLRLDLTQVQKQIALNSQFLSEMERDPQLTERLAQREMHAVQQGEAVVNTNAGSGPLSATGQARQMSPFPIASVPPPPALEAYRPVGGFFAQLCRDPGSHMYVLGAGMMLVAGGLTLGGGRSKDPSL